MNIIEDIAHLYSFLQSVTGKSGQLKFKDRVIEYKAEGRIRKLQWVYDGTARDVKSETSVEARHFQSTQGAIQHAIKKLIDDLKAKGILN
ncbi:uncharacterized protein [Pocillopora verrucosa]